MRAKLGSNSRPNPWRGLFGGTLGGLIGSFLMTEFYSLLVGSESNVKPGKEDSTVRAASAISQMLFHHAMTANQKAVAGSAVHYLFGASMGATYGLLVEFWGTARIGWGLPFGAIAWLGAYVITVPALGLSEPITHNTPGTEAIEGAAHLVYGCVVEGVRRLFRKILQGGPAV